VRAETPNQDITIIRFNRDDVFQPGYGGTTTIARDAIVTRKARLSSDYGLFKTVVKGQTLWIVNVYLSKGSKTQIQELFMGVERYLTVDDMKHLIIVGDFNVNLRNCSDQLDLIGALGKQLGLSVIDPLLFTRRGATLDFALVPKQAAVRIDIIETVLSDHHAIRLTISIPDYKRTRTFRILDRSVASAGTLNAVWNSRNASDFLHLIHKFRKVNKLRIFKTLKRRQVERKLFLALVKEKTEETKTILTKYWEELIEGNEKLRYSVQSKEAFQFLKRVFKYNQFERRDGSIADRVVNGGHVITEESDVNRLIMENLKSIQVNETYPSYEGHIPFPKLGCLSKHEVEDVLKRFYPGKAFTDDCISDDIFLGEHRDKVIEILCDLWD